MIITVVTMGMMKVTIYEIINMVSMGNRFVSTPWPMNVIWIVPLATVLRRAPGRVDLGNLQGVLLDLTIRTHMMHVPIVQVVDVTRVFDSRMFAVRTVLMIVVAVYFPALHVTHFSIPLQR